MGYLVTIEPLGLTIEVDGGQTILDAALRQGVYLPHACGHGLCGTCKVDVLEGEVEINYGKELYKLSKGDSIYLDSIVLHNVHAGNKQSARILAVIYAPF